MDIKDWIGIGILSLLICLIAIACIAILHEPVVPKSETAPVSIPKHVMSTPTAMSMPMPTPTEGEGMDPLYREGRIIIKDVSEHPSPVPTRMVSGVGGEFHYNNGICETILVSGVENTVYVDRCDEVKVSGIDNKIIRTENDYYEPEDVHYKPMGTIKKVSGIDGEFHYNNGICETILVSGVENTVYVDRCDEVEVSGIDNKIIRD